MKVVAKATVGGIPAEAKVSAGMLLVRSLVWLARIKM